MNTGARPTRAVDAWNGPDRIMDDFEPIYFGKYELLKKIAKGGMAELYLARITGFEGFEKRIVIKKILPHLSTENDLIKAFIEEAKLAAFLHHQNIVQIYDFGCMDGEYFIAMEHLAGKDLREIARKAKVKNLPLSLENALFITSRTCMGLEYARNLKDFNGAPLNIIHRDISPQNILITSEGEVKIVDFGIAKAVGRLSTTQVGKIKGKISYMSPEQAQGKAVDHRSDLFSAGILLYEMVTRRRMFPGTEAMGILSKVRNVEYERVENIIHDAPPKVVKIIQRAVEKSPDRRYPFARDMLADVEACIDDLSLRPTTRKLSRYMVALFGEKSLTETIMLNLPPSDRRHTPRKATPKSMPTKSESRTRAGPGKGTGSAWQRKGGKIWCGAVATAMACIVIFLLISLKGFSLTGKFEEGVEALDGKEYARASDLFEEILAADSSMRERVSEPYTKALLARASESKQDPEKAKALLQRAVALDKKNHQGYFQLGLLYGREKNYPRAMEMYRRVNELNPEFADAFFNLGYIHVMRDDYAEAELMYLRAVELAPAYLDEALFNLAVVQEKLGKRAKCLQSLEQALVVNPDNELARSELYRLQKSGGENHAETEQ